MLKYSRWGCNQKIVLLWQNSEIENCKKQKTKAFTIFCNLNVRVLVADIEDEAILGIEFFSDVDAKIDMVQQNIVVNWEEMDCYDHDQQLTFRCIVRRLVTIAPNSDKGAIKG